MREHQMNEYQCPFCLHGEAEKERLLSHLLNCHPGRPGKVLLRKQMTSSGSSGPPSFHSSPSLPPPPPPLDPNRKARGGGGAGGYSSKPDTGPVEAKADGVSLTSIHGAGKEGVQVRTFSRR